MKESEKLLGIALVIGGAIWLFKDKISGPGGILDTAIASPLSNAWLALTLPGAVNVRGNAILPNGQAVPLNTLYVDDNEKFTVGGQTYTLTGSDGQGNYLAN